MKKQPIMVLNHVLIGNKQRVKRNKSSITSRIKVYYIWHKW